MDTLFAFDPQLRGCLSELRPEGRLALLTALLLHANSRGRCWPTTNTLVQETGWESAAIVAAKQWLLDAGAIILIPYAERIDEERDLPKRQHVYQLTGRLTVGGKWFTYMRRVSS